MCCFRQQLTPTTQSVVSLSRKSTFYVRVLRQGVSRIESLTYVALNAHDKCQIFCVRQQQKYRAVGWKCYETSFIFLHRRRISFELFSKTLLFRHKTGIFQSQDSKRSYYFSTFRHKEEGERNNTEGERNNKTVPTIIDNGRNAFFLHTNHNKFTFVSVV